MGSFLLECQTRAKEGRQCRSFVVRRAAPIIPSLLRVKDKWRALPLRFIRGLNVEMVVDRNRWTILPGKKLSNNHRVSRGCDLVCSSPALPNVGNGTIRNLPDVSSVFRRCADAGDFNPFL